MFKHIRNTTLIVSIFNIALHPTILVPICTAIAGIATLRYAIACYKEPARIAHKPVQCIAFKKPVRCLVHKG